MASYVHWENGFGKLVVVLISQMFVDTAEGL